MKKNQSWNYMTMPLVSCTLYHVPAAEACQ